MQTSPVIPRNERHMLWTAARVLAFAMLWTSVGCKELTANSGLPAGTPDPASFNTPAGAVGMYVAAMAHFRASVQQYIIDAGLLTDELEDQATGASSGAQIRNGFKVTDPLDERILPEGTIQKFDNDLEGEIDYGNLQGFRAFADQAIGALAAYDTGTRQVGNPAAMRAELYALEGYTEIMLADFFCSGVPLSTLDFQHDFTYRPSSTTAAVYQAAVAKFDTARMLAVGNDTLLNLARIGEGRALLDLDSAAAAANLVAAVPDGFAYVTVDSFYQLDGHGHASAIFGGVAAVADRDGGTGLPYISSGDPRTAVVFQKINDYGDSLFFPMKYSTTVSGGFSTKVPLASGIEARLLQAEAALRQSDPTQMLTLLNHLRETARVPGQTTTLADTSDPGAVLTGTAATGARLTLLFRERAYWLFLTGQRQGDLRRLLRQYSQYPVAQSQARVYPTGAYRALGAGQYGTDVTAPIPQTEYANPLYHGCLNREP